MKADARKRAAVHGYQSDIVDWKRPATMAGALAAALLLVALAAWGVFALLRPSALPSSTPPANIAGPRLQAAPTLDLKALRQENDARLNQYRWIDRERGVVQIPIERAMQLMAERNNANQRGPLRQPR
jgi:hypothetical protein